MPALPEYEDNPSGWNKATDKAFKTEGQLFVGNPFSTSDTSRGFNTETSPGRNPNPKRALAIAKAAHTALNTAPGPKREAARTALHSMINENPAGVPKGIEILCSKGHCNVAHSYYSGDRLVTDCDQATSADRAEAVQGGLSAAEAAKRIPGQHKLDHLAPHGDVHRPERG